MKTARAPSHWTLYGVESFRTSPSESASSSRSSCSSAARRSSVNGHSYGYETNGMRSCRSSAAHGAGASATSSVATIRGSPASPLAASARHSSAASALNPRYTASGAAKTRLPGSRNEPRSCNSSVVVVALADSEELQQPPPVQLRTHGDRRGAAGDHLEDHAPRAGVEVAEKVGEHGDCVKVPGAPRRGAEKGRWAASARVVAGGHPRDATGGEEPTSTGAAAAP